MNTKELEQVIEGIAPAKYACRWDNTGYNVNLHNREIGEVMVCLDVTPEIVEEAAQKGCGAIVSHHPLLFHETKTIDTESFAGRCIRELIKHDISLYCAHTSMDSVRGGLNTWLANVFGLREQRFLETEYTEPYYKIAVSVPVESAQAVRDALSGAGAGKLGNYSHCAFSVLGEGTFRPEEGADPYLGSRGRQETVEEVWIQALAPENRLREAVAAVKDAHPYEVPAIDVFLLQNIGQPEAGLGVVGDLERPLPARQALDILKKALLLPSVRFHGNPEEEVRRIAVCSGAGGDLVFAAQRAGAQLYVTGEVKHNYYMESEIAIAEAGHFDTEKCFCAIMAEGLQKALDDVKYNVIVHTTERMDRPYIDY